TPQLYTLSLHDALPIYMRIVPTMHARKALMADLSDAFVALPGGYGTADEFFEMLTWAQLRIHAKPIRPMWPPPNTSPRRCCTSRSEEHTSELPSRSAHV